MTVKQLIERLQGFDDNTWVYIATPSPSGQTIHPPLVSQSPMPGSHCPYTIAGTDARKPVAIIS